MTSAVVAILDANALIDLKKVRVSLQWKLFRELEELVRAGAICVPNHVIREVSDVPHPDTPGTWAKGIEQDQQYQLEADPRYVSQVMGGRPMAATLWEEPILGVPEVLDQHADTEQADPYVVAMALQFKTEARDCVVVTSDSKDRPGKTSPAKACQILGIRTATIEEYLDWGTGPHRLRMCRRSCIRRTEEQIMRISRCPPNPAMPREGLFRSQQE